MEALRSQLEGTESMFEALEKDILLFRQYMLKNARTHSNSHHFNRLNELQKRLQYYDKISLPQFMKQMNSQLLHQSKTSKQRSLSLRQYSQLVVFMMDAFDMVLQDLRTVLLKAGQAIGSLLSQGFFSGYALSSVSLFSRIFTIMDHISCTLAILYDFFTNLLDSLAEEKTATIPEVAALKKLVGDLPKELSGLALPQSLGLISPTRKIEPSTPGLASRNAGVTSKKLAALFNPASPPAKVPVAAPQKVIPSPKTAVQQKTQTPKKSPSMPSAPSSAPEKNNKRRLEAPSPVATKPGKSQPKQSVDQIFASLLPTKKRKA
eukprot:TRINITY_DN22281_c0_g1_i1.p1 TRINITY_DN22281_c0_g1~~TRINITY_DN22281_c0_g1_i1.p1  ORF type:complete len:361 (-),score=49.10 TRINITY_DN22281_c0_g1_i1:317-1276(-)